MQTALKAATYLAIAVVVLALVLVQTLVRASASEDASRYPEVADYAAAYGLAAVVAIAGVQVALLALGRLVSLATSGRVVGRPGLAWLAVITWSLAASTAITAVVVVHQMSLPAGRAAGPIVIWLMIVAAAGCMATLVTLVVRQVLLRAIAADRELAEVI
ncbi:DUF2975 domain-containing protein [Demequina capsici]|uniref:DUF2975 domain-containing protein n=1 Tax=Demequina capsici TaxID=3075620 RepID=A0AA96F6Q1_9MICO|nr:MULTISPECIES: DUF2975 domain-containing protein [unclassified Demequina]WNM24828.1 DUF2975 domain-containing protein [Demequina sp. OYTSA14]WNM27735.1 DUF2975 domain-containing protein [Demequina sp. PMTSA13]